MAEEQVKRVYISLENLSLYDKFLRSYMDAGDRKALKTVSLSDDGKKLLFYTVAQPIGETSPAFEIEIPEPKLDWAMRKLTNATVGNIGIFDNTGAMADSGVAIDNLVTVQTMAEEVARQIAMSSALKKEIVDELPSDSNAKENVIYMIKDDSIVEGDAYEEWMLISGKLVQIGTTSISLDGYYTSLQINDLIDNAMKSAITSAVEQANANTEIKVGEALVEAKAYTDTKTKDFTTDIGNLRTDVDKNTSDISAINLVMDAHGKRLTSLEEFNKTIVFATDEDIQALFTKK